MTPFLDCTFLNVAGRFTYTEVFDQTVSISGALPVQKTHQIILMAAGLNTRAWRFRWPEKDLKYQMKGELSS